MDHKMELGAIEYFGWVDIPCTDVERIQRDERLKNALLEIEQERRKSRERESALMGLIRIEPKSVTHTFSVSNTETSESVWFEYAKNN